jgi:hypothetical protein
MPQNFASLPPAPARASKASYTQKMTRKVNFVLVEPSRGKKAKQGEFSAIDAKVKKVSIDVPLPSRPAGTAPHSFVELAALKNAIHGERNLTSHIPFDNLGIFVKVSAGSTFYSLTNENISFHGSTAVHVGVGLIANDGHVRQEDMEIERLKMLKKQKVVPQAGAAIPVPAFAMPNLLPTAQATQATQATHTTHAAVGGAVVCFPMQ